MNQPTKILINLGFTQLEADIYVFLVQESPATGYRVAQGIDKPVANTYKAIQSLQSKGAILVDEGQNRQCRAVPVQEFLAQLESKFMAMKQEATHVLSKLETVGNDDRIYQLRNREQVMQRLQNMLQNCQDIAVLDASPRLLDEIHPILEKTIARGVRVGIKTYDAIKIKGAFIYQSTRSQEIQQRWPGQWLNLIIDGNEHIFSYFTDDGQTLRQAIWSASAYLSWIHYGALQNELMMAGIEGLLQKGTSIKEIKQAVSAYNDFFLADTIGYKRLTKRFS